MTLGEWILEAAARLARVGIESPRLEAQVLAASILDKDRSWVLAHAPTYVLEDVQPFGELLVRRLSREPLAYILGSREFYGRRFLVTKDVLIPRQETELLVETALELADEGATLLDLGTGSGCVALTIKAEDPTLLVTAVDISPAALTVARTNALGLDLEVEFLESDWFSTLEDRRFDLLVSNPPYVKVGDPALEPEVAIHEPATALFAGEDGLDAYRALLGQAGPHLNPGGWLLMEIGQGQREAIEALAGRECDWMTPDLSGIERVLGFQFG